MSPGARRLSFERVLDAIFHGPLIFSYMRTIMKVKDSAANLNFSQSTNVL